MSEIDLTPERVNREVQRLFKQQPPIPGQLCINPVTGGWYVGGYDPLKKQFEAARPLLPGPRMVPLRTAQLMLSHFRSRIWEREALKGTGLLAHILAWYARSLDGRNYDVDEHPSFADYAAGVLWEAQLRVGGFAGLPNYPAQEFEELKKRFPPKMLKGMGPGLYWEPSKGRREAMASVRRSSSNPEFISIASEGEVGRHVVFGEGAGSEGSTGGAGRSLAPAPGTRARQDRL